MPLASVVTRTSQMPSTADALAESLEKRDWSWSEEVSTFLVLVAKGGGRGAAA